MMSIKFGSWRRFSARVCGCGGHLRSMVGRPWRVLLIAACLNHSLFAQQPFTWQQIRERFEATNPTLQAARIGIDESRAEEVTAYLRPNPNFTFTFDQIQAFTPNPYRPLALALPFYSASYLHERLHKRELRLESPQKATQIAKLQLADQKRTLLYNLANALLQTSLTQAHLRLSRSVVS